MTIIQHIPQWLRSRWQKPAPQKARIPSKKDWQILPTLAKTQRPPVRLQDDDSPPEYPLYWRTWDVRMPPISTK